MEVNEANVLCLGQFFLALEHTLLALVQTRMVLGRQPTHECWVQVGKRELLWEDMDIGLSLIRSACSTFVQ